MTAADLAQGAPMHGQRSALSGHPSHAPRPLKAGRDGRAAAPAPPTRRRRAAEAAALRAGGLTATGIAARMGVSRSYAYELLNDPDGSGARARKDRYQGVCEDCGAATNGADGRGPNASRRCVRCASIVSGEARVIWTRDRVVAAIREWRERYGRIPFTCEWNPTIVRAGRAAEGCADVYLAEPGRWPHYYTVRRAFGTWSEAIRAAGYEPRRQGERI